jgi:hypothetical protein
VDCELDLTSRRCGSFGDQLRLDPARVSERGEEKERKEDQEPFEHSRKRYSFVQQLQNRFTVR